jgi:hypothetical protein
LKVNRIRLKINLSNDHFNLNLVSEKSQFNLLINLCFIVNKLVAKLELVVPSKVKIFLSLRHCHSCISYFYPYF